MISMLGASAASIMPNFNYNRERGQRNVTTKTKKNYQNLIHLINVQEAPHGLWPRIGQYSVTSWSAHGQISVKIWSALVHNPAKRARSWSNLSNPRLYLRAVLRPPNSTTTYHKRRRWGSFSQQFSTPNPSPKPILGIKSSTLAPIDIAQIWGVKRSGCSGSKLLHVLITQLGGELK